MNQLDMADCSPEKAGVGGSIPSLATRFSNLQAAIASLGCVWLHFYHTSSHRPRSLHVRGELPNCPPL
jgi:hypothetical protein